MRHLWILGVFALGICLLPAVGQELSIPDGDLERKLVDVNQEWLCAGPYEKAAYKDCVEARSKFWVDQFFEVVGIGDVLNKAEMVATQTSRIGNPATAPGTGPYPDALKLIAVYGDGNFAMGTDHTNFKTVDANGDLAFTSSSKVLRLFVKEDGTWRPAAAGLVPIVAAARGPASTSVHLSTPRKSPDEKLEKHLAEIDRIWLESAMTKRLDYISNLFADRWFEILGWNPTGNVVKATTLVTLARANRKPGEGVVADQFRLEAIHADGNVALATDRRTRTWTDAKGQLVKTPHRSLLVFVKQNGEWKSAGASLTPIMYP